MAVAMEVAWRGAELGVGGGSGGGISGKKRAWGADTEKLMQLMMGHFGSVPKPEPEATLDLLGAASSPGTSRASPSQRAELDCNSPPEEFLELDPDHPLPSDWEKCLDLKTGELYYVNKSTGARTSDDPRKQQPTAREFLGSKRSETLREESLSGGQLLSFSTGKQLWSLQLDDRSTTVSLNRSSSPRGGEEEESGLELDLNLSAGGSSHQQQQQSVCTMEMVEQALKRTEKALGKREMPKLSASSSFSSLTSDPNHSWSHSSPSTSSSSSTSQQAFRSSASGACEAESRKAETTLVMGACTRCLMYVMLHKSDPRCPRCESEVPLDFSSIPSSKRQRVETAVQTL